MGALNQLALGLGWILIIGIGALSGLLTICLFWQWLTEQMWEAGYRVRRRWERQKSNQGGPDA